MPGEQVGETFDFVVIGSGFGGSVAAMRLAEKGYRVLVLERGSVTKIRILHTRTGRYGNTCGRHFCGVLAFCRSARFAICGCCTAQGWEVAAWDMPMC